MHIKSEKAKKATKHTLYLTLELTENNQRSINKSAKYVQAILQKIAIFAADLQNSLKV